MIRRCLPLVSLPKLDIMPSLGEDRGRLRLARLEQVGHARQTTGDVAGLRRFLRDAWRQYVTDADGRRRRPDPTMNAPGRK